MAKDKSQKPKQTNLPPVDPNAGAIVMAAQTLVDALGEMTTAEYSVGGDIPFTDYLRALISVYKSTAAPELKPGQRVRMNGRDGKVLSTRIEHPHVRVAGAAPDPRCDRPMQFVTVSFGTGDSMDATAAYFHACGIEVISDQAEDRTCMVTLTATRHYERTINVTVTAEEYERIHWAQSVASAGEPESTRILSEFTSRIEAQAADGYFGRLDAWKSDWASAGDEFDACDWKWLSNGKDRQHG